MSSATATGKAAALRSLGTGTASHRRSRNVLTAYLLLLPAALLSLGFPAYSLAWEGWVSLTDVSTRSAPGSYVGLVNYWRLGRDPEFWTAVGITLSFLIATTFLKLAAGIGAATALERPLRNRPWMVLAVSIPWAYPAWPALIGWYRFTVPPVHTAYSGVMASLQFFVDAWLGRGASGFLSLVLFNIWRGGSFVALIVAAAFITMSRDLLDCAALDATRWQRFWGITLPLLRPYLALAAFLSLPQAIADLGNISFLSGQRDIYPIIWIQALDSMMTSGEWSVAAARALAILPALAAILLTCYRLFGVLEDDWP